MMAQRLFYCLFYLPLVCPVPLPERFRSWCKPPQAELVFSGQFAWIVDKLDYRHLGVVALTSPELNNASITAVAVLVTCAELAKQPLNCRNTGCTLDLVLCLALFTAK